MIDEQQKQIAELTAERDELKQHLAEVRHQRDMSQAFQAAIWKVTNPGEPEQCIAALKALGAQEMQRERDQLAAQLEIARKALGVIATTCGVCYCVPIPQFECYYCVARAALAQLSDAAAALKEHDKRVAERCAEIAEVNRFNYHPTSFTVQNIRREFGLEAKPE